MSVDSGIDGPTSDVASTCPSGQILCSSMCINPLTSLSSCGASGECSGQNAGETCDKGQICSAGICALTCQKDLVECAGKCIDPQSDLTYCGAALGGQCNSTDTASTDFQGATCPSGQVCAAGTCQTSCLITQVLCGGKCIDPQANITYCGAAIGGQCNSTNSSSADFRGTTCVSGQVCSSGICQISCLSTQVLCGGKCVDPASDLTYCGAALGGQCNSINTSSADFRGTTCAAGQICNAGTCRVSCGSGLTDCGTCVDTNSNPSHCGGCNVHCTKTQICVLGKCYKLNLDALPADCAAVLAANPSATNGDYYVYPNGVGNSPYLAKCDFTCTSPTDILRDNTNCGACGITCAGGGACIDGMCEIQFSALNEAYQGNIGGLATADNLCQTQATTAGVSGTWKAFLSTSTRNVIDLITGNATSLPIRNTAGKNLLPSWTQLNGGLPTSGSGNIITFNGTNIEEGTASPDWYDADAWNGSSSTGLVDSTMTCREWTSNGIYVYGRAGEVDIDADYGPNLLKAETKTCDTYAAVLCVRTSPFTP